MLTLGIIIVWILIVGIIEKLTGGNSIFDASLKDIWEALKSFILFIIIIIIITFTLTSISNYLNPPKTIEDICREEYTVPKHINECIRMKRKEIMHAYYNAQAEERQHKLRVAWIDGGEKCKKQSENDKNFWQIYEHFYVCQANYVYNKYPEDFENITANCSYVPSYQYVECIENILGINKFNTKR